MALYLITKKGQQQVIKTCMIPTDHNVSTFTQ